MNEQKASCCKNDVPIEENESCCKNDIPILNKNCCSQKKCCLSSCLYKVLHIGMLVCIAYAIRECAEAIEMLSA